MKTGLCRHCGKPDAPLTDNGYIDRHYRGDHPIGTRPSGELCAGSAMGGGHLRPGEPCNHLLPNPNCRAVMV
jgi:hypothetical protein